MDNGFIDQADSKENEHFWEEIITALGLIFKQVATDFKLY